MNYLLQEQTFLFDCTAQEIHLSAFPSLRPALKKLCAQLAAAGWMCFAVLTLADAPRLRTHFRAEMHLRTDHDAHGGSGGAPRLAIQLTRRAQT